MPIKPKTRTKQEAENLLQEELSRERALRLEAERIAREQQEELEQSRLPDAGGFGAESIEPDNYMRVRAYCATLGPDDKLAVYRRMAKRQSKFVGSIETNNFDPELVKERFGGGDYIFLGYNESHQIDFRAEMSIEGRPITESDPAVTADHQSPKPQFDAQQLVVMMQESNRAMLKEIAGLFSKPEKSTSDVLNEIKTYKELFAPASTVPAAQPLDQLMAAMKMGAELNTMTNGGGDNNQAWLMKALDIFGKPIMEVIASGQLAKEPPALPGNQPRIAAPSASPQVTEDEPMNLMMKGYIGILAKAARQNAEVTEYADSILDLIPEAEMQTFEAMIRADDWQQRLAVYSASVNDYPGWFLNLRNTVISFIDADREEALLTSVKPGDSVSAHENEHSDKNKAGSGTGNDS